MPKLSPVQWAIVVVFLAFYGFAVFAVTRDYYLRNPPRAVSADASTAQAPAPGGQRTWIQGRMQQGGNAIPAAVTDSNPVLLMQKADALFGQDRYGEAIPLYRRVLELDPKNAAAYNDLGLSLYYSGQLQTALDILKQGTTKVPGFQRLWLTLGFVGAQGSDKAAARSALEKARALGPDNNIGREAQRLLGLLAKK